MLSKPQGLVLLEGLGTLKILMTSLGLESVSYQLLA
jgi:hypothetical protein